MGLSRATGLFLLAAASAQEPSEALVGLRYLPKSAPVVVGVKDLNRRWAELQQTGLGRLLTHPAAARLIEQHLTPLLEQGRGEVRSSGLELDEVLRLVANGATLAVTEISGRGADVVLIVDLGERAEMLGSKLVDQLTRSGATRVTRPGVAWLLTADKPRPWAAAQDGSHLLLATDQKVIVACLERAAAAKGNGSELGRDPEFQALHRRGGAGKEPLALALLRLPAFVPLIERATRANPSSIIDRFMDRSGLSDLKLIAYSVRLAGANMEDSLVVHVNSRKGLLALLPSPSATPLKPMPAPRSAASLTLTRFAPAKVFDALLDVVDAVEPAIRGRLDVMLQENRNRTGVDLRDDLLAHLGDQWLLATGAARDNAVPELWVVGELADAKAFAASLRKFVAAQGERGLPVTESGDGHFAVETTPGNGMEIAVAGTRLVLGARGKEFQDLVAAATKGEVAPRLQELTKGLPGDALGVAWSDVSAMGGGVLGSLGERFGRSDSLAGLSELSDVLGESVSVVRGSASSVEVTTTSPTGNLYGLAALGIAGAVAAPSLLAAGNGGSGQPAAPTPGGAVPGTAAATEILAQVHAGQLALARQGGGFGSMARLIASGFLDGFSGQASEEGMGIAVRGWRVHVLLPEVPDAKTPHYVAVAVPQRRGSADAVALFVDERGTIWSNQVILKLGGDDRLTEADLYDGGLFGGRPLPGWDKVEAATTPLQRAAAARALEDMTGPERLEAIVRAERAKDRAAVPQLLILLKDTTPGIAARAAFALGELRAVEATEALIALAGQAPDAQARAHAIFALARIKDRRATPLLLKALTDPEPRIRAAAATGLSELGAHEASAPLLSALLEGKEDSVEVRTQMVLALADMGDPECLTKVAGQIKDAQGPLAQAVGFLFQSLSPKLPPARETELLVAMLGHDNLVLRKYAIQRLGEARRTEALPALRARVATEAPALQTVLKDTIQALDPASAPHTPPAPSAPPAKGASRHPIVPVEDDRGILAPVVQTLEDLGVTQEMGWGIGGGIAVLGCLLLWLGRRRRDDEDARVSTPASRFYAPSAGAGRSPMSVDQVPAPPAASRHTPHVPR